MKQPLDHEPLPAKEARTISLAADAALLAAGIVLGFLIAVVVL